MSAEPPIDTCFPSGCGRLPVRITPTPATACELAIHALQDVLGARAEPLVGLATGGTYGPFFERLVALQAEGRIALGRVAWSHLDEFHGWGPDRAGGMVRELRDRLFDRLTTPPRAFHPVPTASSAVEAVAAHEAQLEALGPVDLQFLGLGHNGHIAFNEPGTPWVLRSHACALTAGTLEANQGRFEGGDRPVHGITTGPAELMRARRLFLMATGKAKAAAVAELLHGPIGPEVPATLLHLHPHAGIVLDEAAASELDARARWAPAPGEPWFGAAGDLKPDGPVLVISPHPDDASISCGGLLAGLASDVPKVIATVTSGHRAEVPGVEGVGAVTELREEEVRREAAILGADTRFLRARFYDSGVFHAKDALALQSLLEEVQPALVLAPAVSDSHPTHRLTRLVLDEALRQYVGQTGRDLEVWTFEGPWYQHDRERINTVLHFSESAENKKLAAVREHRSQMARVPFDEGAAALARLRGIAFSESHFGGKQPGQITRAPLVEAYVRERYLAFGS